MKRLLLIVSLVMLICVNVYAFDGTNSSAVVKEQDISLVLEEPEQKNRILCYDVNRNGTVVLCQKQDNMYSSKTDYLICVYSDEGIFQYGYRVSSQGSVETKWNEDNIQILWVRRDVVAEMQRDGTMVKCYYIDPYIAGKEFQSALYQKVGEKEYKIQWCGFGSLVNSKLISIDMVGEKRVIYQTNYNTWRMVICAIFMVVVLIMIIIINIHYFRSYMRKSRNFTHY